MSRPPRPPKRQKVRIVISETEYLANDATTLISEGYRIRDVMSIHSDKDVCVQKLKDILKLLCKHDGRGMHAELYDAIANDSCAQRIRGWLFESNDGVPWGAVFAKESFIDRENMVMMDLICVKQPLDGAAKPKNIFKSLLALVLALAVENQLGVDLEAAQIEGSKYKEQNARLLALYEHFGFTQVKCLSEHTESTIYMSMTFETAQSMYLKLIGKSAERVGSECCIT